MRPQRVVRRRRSHLASADGSATPGASEAAVGPGARVIGAWIAGLTVLAAAIHLFGQSRRPLWLDEACTYWTIRHADVFGVLRGVGTDGTPPLHFLLVSAVTGAFGFAEIVLRLPSLAAATALVPVMFVVGRRFGGWRTGVIAAALAAISPIVHYYSVEARSYALVQLETAGVLYAARRAFTAPGDARWWVLLSSALAIELWTNSYTVFLLPAPVLAAIALGTPGTRRSLVIGAAGAAAGACLLWTPWLIQGVTTVGAGVADWLEPFWVATPPWAAIPRSIEVFGFGGAYPSYLGYLGQAPSARAVSVAVSVGLLLAGLVRRGERAGAPLLAAFLFVPLFGAWVSSLAVRPLYLVGRYDTLVVPAFLILIAIGLNRILERRRWLGTGIAAAIVSLAVLSLSTAAGETETPNELDRLAGQVLARDAGIGDAVVATGSRQAVTEYYAQRGGFRGAFSAFPPEIAEHPGWFNADRLLQDRSRLEREGEARARELVTAARQGSRVWLLDSTDAGINQYLFLPLLRDMEVDTARTYRDLALICLKPQARPGGGR